MATVTLHPKSGSSAHHEDGTSVYSLVGSGDPIICITTEADGKYINFTSTSVSSADFSTQFDKSDLPSTSIITEIILTIVHRSSIGGGIYTPAFITYWDTQDANFITTLGVVSQFDAPNDGGILGIDGSFSTWTSTFPTNNPLTGSPWARADFDTIWLGTHLATNGITDYDIDYLALTVTYTSGVWYYNPVTNNYQFTDTAPGSPWQPHDPTIAAASVNPAFGSTLGGD